jgi:hypothetical protein
MDASSNSNNNVNNNSNNNGGGGQKDLSSVLAHIESLQKQLADKTTELSETRQREESAKTQVAQLNDLNAKLTEARREAMREEFNNNVRGWIQGLDSKQVPDVVKKEFLDGAERFVNKGNDTGAWKVSLEFFESCSITHTHTNHPFSPGPLQRILCAPEPGEHDPKID